MGSAARIAYRSRDLLCPICPRSLGVETVVGSAAFDDAGAVWVAELVRVRRALQLDPDDREMFPWLRSSRRRWDQPRVLEASRILRCRNGHELLVDPRAITTGLLRAVAEPAGTIYLRSLRRAS